MNNSGDIEKIKQGIENEYKYQLDVFKNLLLKEKQKSCDIENELNQVKLMLIQLEDELSKKNKQIVFLTKSKNDNTLFLDRASMRLDEIDILLNMKQNNRRQSKCDYSLTLRKESLHNMNKLNDINNDNEFQNSSTTEFIIEEIDKKTRNLTLNEQNLKFKSKLDYEYLYKKSLIKITNLEIQNEKLKDNNDYLNMSLIEIKNKFEIIIKTQNETLNKLNQKVNELNSFIQIKISENESLNIQLKDINNKLNEEMQEKNNNKNELEEIKQDKNVIKSIPTLKFSEINDDDDKIKEKYEKLNEKICVIKNYLLNLKKKYTFNGIKKDIFKGCNIIFSFEIFGNIPSLIIRYENKYKKIISISDIETLKLLNEKEKAIEIRYFSEKGFKEKIYYIEQEPKEFIDCYKKYNALYLNLDLINRLDM